MCSIFATELPDDTKKRENQPYPANPHSTICLASTFLGDLFINFLEFK
jgi:hypothetical protein